MIGENVHKLLNSITAEVSPKSFQDYDELEKAIGSAFLKYNHLVSSQYDHEDLYDDLFNHGYITGSGGGYNLHYFTDDELADKVAHQRLVYSLENADYSKLSVSQLRQIQEIIG